jgi:GT2 family glycosyltransferase|tara:strand:- start:80 stop:940 length:861 start_codon:yes stop_codon:yes gene_type:complete
MNLDLKEITFIIVTYKAKKIIYNCINSLPKFSKKIVVENSYDRELKSDLESKYDNIEVILNENQGMGASNNIGIKKATTKYAFVINPDVVFKENTFLNLVEEVKNIDNFSIISPINTDKNFPNYKIQNNYPIINDHIVEVDTIDGFSMLINKSKFADQTYFDENFFLYLENTDLCLRQKNKKEKIFIIKNSEIKHIGSYTTKLDLSNNLEYIRNWHWMWSKFYFNRKHYGYFIAVFKTLNNLASASLKYLLYALIFNKHKKTIYKMRILGLVNSMIGKKSYLRPNN